MPISGSGGTDNQAVRETAEAIKELKPAIDTLTQIIQENNCKSEIYNRRVEKLSFVILFFGIIQALNVFYDFFRDVFVLNPAYPASSQFPYFMAFLIACVVVTIILFLFRDDIVKIGERFTQ